MENTDSVYAKGNSSHWTTRLQRILVQELSPKLTGFNGVHPKLFATPQFSIPFQPISWIVLKGIRAMYLVVWLFITLSLWGEKPPYPTEADTKWKFFIYASDWAYMTVCTYFTFSAVSTFLYHWRTSFKDTSKDVNLKQTDRTELIESGQMDPDGNFILPWYMKATWLLKNLIYPAIILTSFLRWGVNTGQPDQYESNIADLHIHGVGLAFVIVDLIAIASPYRMQHVVYPMISVIIYYCFTLLYFFCGGTNDHHLNKDVDGDTYLYREKLDWGKYPKTTGFFMLIMVFAGIPIVHFGIYLLFKLKGHLIEWYYFYKQGLQK